jgi:hypothetical protein
VKPSAPNHAVRIGVVARTSPTNGRIIYSIINGFELNELHNVSLSSEANNDVLSYESATSLWKNKTIATLLGMSTAGANLVTKVAPTPIYNQSVAQQGAGFATDTYLTGSSIAIPNSSLQVGARYKLVFDVSKTAAGTATPIITIRVGTNGTTADTARLTFTFLAQTAAADIGTFEFWVTFRSVGSGTSAVLQGTGQVRHRLSTTGLQNLPSPTLQVTSGGFDSTVSNLIIGASVNGGTSASWTVQMVQAELNNLI